MAKDMRSALRTHSAVAAATIRYEGSAPDWMEAYT
jgi:hypothetical protein